MIDSSRFGLRIVVLAAGFSSRLGQPKALARLHGTSLVRRTVDVLARVTRLPIMVITPPRATRLRVELRGCPVLLISNAMRAGGLSTSVKLALQQTRFNSGTLLLPADLPALTARDMRRLIARWRGQPRRVVARSAAGQGLTPLILPKALHPRARLLCGDIGLRDFVAGLPADHRILVELPSAERDVDTPEDLATARRRLVAIH